MKNTINYKGKTIRVIRNSVGKVNRVVVIGQHADFSTIKTAKRFVSLITQ